MLGDISYDEATLKSEGKQSIHIHIAIFFEANKNQDNAKVALASSNS